MNRHRKWHLKRKRTEEPHFETEVLIEDDVIIAFTGDEEEEGTGAKNVADFLKSEGKIPLMSVILDGEEV